MFNRKSIYALNKKDPNAIVYTDADGNLIRLTCDDFSSEEEFLHWKVWSDSDFHAEDKHDVSEDKHSVSLDSLSEEALALPAVDIVMERHHERIEEQRQATEKVAWLKETLTETQFRRLWMYRVKGMTETEIAQKEGVGQRRISTSITDAEKKLKKILRDE